MGQLKHIRIVAESPKEEKLETAHGPMTILNYPELGRNIRVLAVLDDGTELDLSSVVSNVEWAVQPGVMPVARVTVLAPELDVEGWVEHLQLSPQEKVIRRIGMAERREKEGLPRENFGPRFQVIAEENVGYGGNSLEYAWHYAWRCATSDERLEERAYEYPPVPATIEGSNRLLEKRRLATGQKPVRIQEWIEGDWVG